MESTEADLNLLHKLRPPRLEDAGLEDCALPPHSIHQAFLKAASAVRSRATSILSGDDDDTNSGCISDPWTDISPPSDSLVGIEPEKTLPGPCAVGKGGAFVEEGESASDVVVVGEGNEEDDVVVVGGGDGGDGGDCVDGLRGLDIKGKGNERDEEDDKKPTLVEGYFMNR